jgi:hypothetical protein
VASPDEGYLPDPPELGKAVLKLEMKSKLLVGRDGKALPIPIAVERAFLAVDSPPVRLPPGTLVRVSGWVKVPKDSEIRNSTDGVLFYDDAGGEPLGVRLTNTRDDVTDQPIAVWKQFHLYRRVPATGKISVTLALTGLGVAYFDDIRIEPLYPTTAAAPSATAAKRVPIPAADPATVTPAGYRGGR